VTRPFFHLVSTHIFRILNVDWTIVASGSSGLLALIASFWSLFSTKASVSFFPIYSLTDLLKLKAPAALVTGACGSCARVISSFQGVFFSTSTESASKLFLLIPGKKIVFPGLSGSSSSARYNTSNWSLHELATPYWAQIENLKSHDTISSTEISFRSR